MVRAQLAAKMAAGRKKWTRFAPLVYVFLVHFMAQTAEALYLQGTETSYAKYVKWNACINASLSFEFKTLQTESLLMYMDDSGRYDFFEILQSNGRITLTLNIVDGTDGSRRIYLGNNLNDGKWHRVKLSRNRMETTLTVDKESDSILSFGSDFHFGNLSTNSEVYFGGMPIEFNQNLHDLALPSVVFHSHFKGSIRNVLYSNCTCQTTRAPYVSGVGVDTYPPETCDVRNECLDGCVCISREDGPACDCQEQDKCGKGTVTHYRLPMDVIVGSTLMNPSGLDAMALGAPDLIRGIMRKAIRLIGRQRQYVRVSGPGHRYECFGDLDKCTRGHTMAFWVNFEKPVDGESVYLSNGGHSVNSHGVAMLYNNGKLEFRFRKKNGEEWRAKSDDVLPGRWYHVTVSWGPKEGLFLYLNGKLIDRNISPTFRPGIQYGSNNEFMIGRANDGSGTNNLGTILVDEFNFWSDYKNAKEIRELGPFYRYFLPMEKLRGGQFSNANIKASAKGNPSLVPGKIGNALSLDGRKEYIDLGSQTDTCLGDLNICQYGLTVGMWIQFHDLQDNTYFLTSGNKGFKLYYKDNQLHSEFQKGTSNWKVSTDKPETGRWYFLELSWNEENGLRMYLDQEEVARAKIETTVTRNEIDDSNLYIGRANTNMNRERYAAATIDELEMWYGDRERLILFDFLQRGRPTMQFFDFDNAIGSRLIHPSLQVNLHGSPKLVHGKIDRALMLDGNQQYADMGNNAATCFGNLDLCRHGFLISKWIKPGQFREGMKFLSSGKNGVLLSYENGQLTATLKTSTREWKVSTDKLRPDKWVFFELNWHPDYGLAMYAMNEKISESKSAVARTKDVIDLPGQENFYVGRGGSTSSSYYGNMTVDEMEYWYGRREYLLAHNYIHRGKPTRYYFDMDAVTGNRLVHPSLMIPTYGGPVLVPGKINKALRLNGNLQYVDIGEHPKNCLGDLGKCPHGFTVANWLLFRNHGNNMYYLSTGTKGVNFYHRNGRLYVSFRQPGKKWEVPIPNLKKNKWYFIEASWHPQQGLKVYVDRKLAAETRDYQMVPDVPDTGINKVFVGRANTGDTSDGRFTYMDGSIDELEMWFDRREDLIAFDYIQRDNIPHLFVPMEIQRGNTIVHPNVYIPLFGGARTGEGIIGDGVYMNGNGQYLTFGDQRLNCMGNLEMCNHGLTVRMWVKPNQLQENTYFLDSGPYSIYYKNGRLHSKFSTNTKTWTTSTNLLTTDQWQQLEVTWHPERGLHMYINGTSVAHTKDFTTHPTKTIRDWTVYLGRPGTGKQGTYANAHFDEVQFWSAPREILIAFGLINHEIEREIITMDAIRGDTLVHEKRIVYIHGRPVTVDGYLNKAVYLNGNEQHIDVGDSEIVCDGDLENCIQGFTLRFKIEPEQIKNNQYIISSAPIDVYFKDGRLVADFRTTNQKWTVSTPQLDPQEWHQVDLTWDPETGLSMFTDNTKVGQQIFGTHHTDVYDVNNRFYVGRANTDMRTENYGHFKIDDLQLWKARRDILVGKKLIIVDKTPTPTPSTGPIPTFYTFNGQWIMYDFRKLPESYLQHSDREQVMITFKTDVPDGMIWYTGDLKKSMHLSLKDGNLMLVGNYIDEKGTKTDTYVSRVINGRYNDGKWHRVVITRDGRQINFNVDGRDNRHVLSEDIDLVMPGIVYLGGSGETRRITNNVITKNFFGEVKEAVMKGNTLPGDLDLLNLVLRPDRPNYVIINGRPDWGVDLYAVTFKTLSSHIRLPKYKAQKGGKILVKFRTLEPNGLILFNGGGYTNKDFMSVEMYDGILYFIIDVGTGVQRFPFPGKRLDDGLPHTAQIVRNGLAVEITLDGKTKRYRLPAGTTKLDLSTFLYVGGIDVPSSLSWYLWTRRRDVPRGFMGCLLELRVNDDVIDLPMYVRDQLIGGVVKGCTIPPLTCTRGPCDHGVCHNRWRGYHCDCSETHFTGRNCQIRSPILVVNGKQYVNTRISPMWTHHVNDISIRFKSQTPDGLIFVTSNSINADYLKAFLVNGRVRLETNLGDITKTITVGSNLNDGAWHTLYIRRRANDLKVWVDDGEPQKTLLGGSGFTMDVDQIYVAGTGRASKREDKFSGQIKNFYYNGYDLFLDAKFGGSGTIINGTKIPEFPVTFRPGDKDIYITIPPLQIPRNMKMSFLFKTKDGEGLLFYNPGTGDDFIALELVRGNLLFEVNDGSGPRIISARSPGKLSDNQWHHVEIMRAPRGFQIKVDGVETAVNLGRGPHRLDLIKNFYVGGVPNYMYGQLPSVITSQRGFTGCIASVLINGRTYNLQQYISAGNNYIKAGCLIHEEYCTKDICRHYGICTEGETTYICNCNMTGYEGRHCTGQPIGYRYGKNFGNGVIIWEHTQPIDTSSDNIAFGFMTWRKNGTLVRLDSETGKEYILIKMENGFVVVEYDIGNGKVRMVENKRTFNDGQYHVVHFRREGNKASFRVDDFPAIIREDVGSKITIFEGQKIIKVGGNRDIHGKYFNVFRGILAGVYINGVRVMDKLKYGGDIRVTYHGDIIEAPRPFFLPREPTPGPATTPHPTRPVDPDPKGGGGVVWETIPGGKGIVIGVVPGGVGGGAVGEGGPISGKVVQPVPIAGGVEGGRALVALGALLGALLFLSSLIWAVYQCKPGIIPCGGGGGGGGGGMKISNPRTTTNYHLVSQSGGPGAGYGWGTGGGTSGTYTASSTVVNGSAGAVVATAAKTSMETQTASEMSTQTLSNYFPAAGSSLMEHSSFSRTEAWSAGGGGGAPEPVQWDCATQTAVFETIPGAVATATAGGAADAHMMGGQAYGKTISSSFFSETKGFSSVDGGYGQGYSQTLPHGAGGGASYAQATGTMSSGGFGHGYGNTLSVDGGGLASSGYNTAASSYQMRNMTLNSGGTQLMSMGHGSLGGGVPNLMGAEEIRVDCVLLTSDGRHVVTGSNHGPPQIWDMKTGALIRIMDGEDLSSTDLHLACGDGLLVGQVAEMTQIDPQTGHPISTAGTRIQHRKLQIWDFHTGRPLEMAQNEYCTASVMMQDGEKVVLGRTEKFGGGTSIVIWDLMGNEPVRQMRYDAAIGFADGISYLNLSRDNRYVIAGFQNSFDGNANFIVFDMTQSNYNIVEPKIIALDADSSCTAILDNHEAVTGTRKGELTIWSMKTGKPLRQLVSTGGHNTMSRLGVSASSAHTREVKAVDISSDGRFLVSASADSTLKLWNMETEKHLHTMKGHMDEVWCCCISKDNDIVASGSCDGTIRLWRMRNGSQICGFSTGVDVFSVKMSNDKNTIVALGDKYHSRKLIMLQIVHTKSSSRAASRANTPSYH